MVEDRLQWWAVVNTAMNLLISQKGFFFFLLSEGQLAAE
jgi:hypothetical protein